MSLSRGVLIEAILLAEKRELMNYNELLKIYYDAIDSSNDFYNHYIITIPKDISKLSVDLLKECYFSESTI